MFTTGHPLHPLRRGNQIFMLGGAAAGGMGNSCESALKVGGAVLSGDLGGNMISRGAERASHIVIPGHPWWWAPAA